MKAVIDLKLLKDLENDDILVFKNGIWTNIRKNEYVAHLLQPIEQLKNEVKSLKNEIDRLNKLVKELRGEE